MALKVDLCFHRLRARHAPIGSPFSGIIHTNIDGTNGYLLTWFAPSNDLFVVQWATTLPAANWISFTNVVSYNTNFPANATRAQFNFFDDGSQDGGLTIEPLLPSDPEGQENQANTLTLPAQPNLVVGTQTASRLPTRPPIPIPMPS